ncbi:MAG: hypothetical protein K6E40_02355 [Desulfovibrio sp.]|nr:hypothetical protein [Desulfovibrio sp.]
MAELWEIKTALEAHDAGRRLRQEEAIPGRKLEEFVLDCLAWAFVAWMVFVVAEALFF